MNSKNKIALTLAVMGLCASGVAIGATSAIGVRAEGEGVSEETSLPVSEETSTEETQSESAGVSDSAEEAEGKDNALKEAYDKIYGWVNEKVVPLMGGVTVASVMSAIVAIATAIMKHRGDIKNKALLEGQSEKVEVLKALVEVLKSNEDEMYKTYSEVFEKLSATTEITANQAKTIAELVAEQNGQIAKVEKMKESIEVACELISKSLALSETAVKSGVAQDAKKLIENLKEVSGNGGE